ncbi:MAG: hypothetical protein J7518_09150 [Nocardioidaceae bacterium]|nr:hypothetical protein [Nocardioidaceae bacterium]
MTPKRSATSPTHVVPPGFGPLLLALLAGDRDRTAEVARSLAEDRVAAGETWLGFRADLDRAWRAIGRKPSRRVTAAAAAAWPEHAA